MKKVFLFLMVIALSVFTLSAQQRSIEGFTTYGLFNNALDAAATIDESVTDLDFSTLGKDYLFAGVAGNPQLLNNSANTSGLLLGYYKAAEKPWSVFTDISWTGTEDQGPGPHAVDNGVDTVTKYNYRLFNYLNPNATFLMNFGGFSTGLGLDVYLEDNKVIANNYEQTNSATNTTTEMKAKNFTTDLSLSVPFYMEKEKLSHYAKLNVGLTIVDKSSSNYQATNGTATVDNETKNIATTISPSVLYKLSMPTEKLGTFYGSGKIGFEFLSTKNTFDNTISEFSTNADESFSPGVNVELISGLRMEQSTDGDWLRFRLNPEATYSFNSELYQTGSTSSITSGGTTSTITYVGGKYQDISNSLTLSLRSAMEVKPEKWIVGLMLGARGSVGFTNTIQTERAAKLSNQEADEPTNKTVNNNWTARAYANFGIFIPLPNGYRFDIAVDTGQNLLVPANLRMQLIVPLGKTTGF